MLSISDLVLRAGTSAGRVHSLIRRDPEFKRHFIRIGRVWALPDDALPNVLARLAQKTAGA